MKRISSSEHLLLRASKTLSAIIEEETVHGTPLG
jgi:hypothetical protein